MVKRITLIFIIIIIVIGGAIYISYDAKKEDKIRENIKENEKSSLNSIYSYLKMELNDENIIYSPLSIRTAFSMLREGSSGETKEELDKLFTGVNIKKYKTSNKLSFANSLFINNNYKNNIKNSYIKTLKNKYFSEINYDDFNGPDAVNNWVNKNTLGLIDKVLDTLTPDEKLVLVNALAIDVSWMKKFETTNTYGEDFILLDDTEYKATTMHNTYSKYASYYKDEDLTAVSLDLEKINNVNLEFIAIMPNDLKQYVNTLDNKVVNKLLSKMVKVNESKKLRLSLPKFKFDYSLKLKEDLNALGLNKVFTSNAELEKIGKDLFVDDAIHKATIDLSEEGVKAAAVTAITLKANAMDTSKYVDININKPFVFIIRDKNTSDIWFIGTVLKPNNWEDDKEEYNKGLEM